MKINPIAKFALRIFLLCSTASAAIVYDVTLDTSPLIGHPAGPFSLFFQLNDGAGTGNGDNSVVLQNFDFGAGGSASGVPIVIGDASGDLATGVGLTDTQPSNWLLQDFIPGALLSFQAVVSTNVESGFSNDSFVFTILDGTFIEIPTQGGPFFDVLLAVSIDSDNPTTFIFGSDPSRDPAGSPGFPIIMNAPEVTSIPEPVAGLSVAAGLGIAVVRLLRRRKAPPRY